MASGSADVALYTKQSSSITVVLDSLLTGVSQHSDERLDALDSTDFGEGASPSDEVPRKLPVPVIICQLPALSEPGDSWRWRRRLGTGTATGLVRHDGRCWGGGADEGAEAVGAGPPLPK